MINENNYSEREDFLKALNEERRSIYEDLTNAGLGKIKKLDSHYNITKEEKRKLIPILLKHLQLDYHPMNKSTIAIFLSTMKRMARKEGWNIIIKELKKTPPNEDISNPLRRGYKGALLNVIYEMSTEEDIPTLLEIVKDSRHGSERIILLNKIGISKNKKAKLEIAQMKNIPGFEFEIARLQKKGRIPQ